MDKKFSNTKILILLVVLLVLLAVVSVLENHPAKTQLTPTSFSYATTTIVAPDGTIIAQVADTIDEETQGLSDRASLPQGTGMLFVFDTSAPQYMWMKDMEFPLDMVWLDQNKKVVYVASNLTPETYTQNPPEIFSSPTLALYVIEIPSGDANRLGIVVGKTLSFALSH